MRLAKLKAKFRAFRTDEKEIETRKIAAMLFCVVFLGLLWQFKARGRNIFKIAVGFA